MENSIILNNNVYHFNCPHCNILIQVEKNQINCKIFRCGIYKSNGQPIGPHTKKEECDRLFNQELIYGCSKPFKFNGKVIEKCGYE